MTGRAKWDAWSAASKTYRDRVDDAEARYIAIARSLGWSEDKEPEHDDEGELDLDSDDEGGTIRGGNGGGGGGGGGSGLGASVSMMSASQEKSGSIVNDLAIAGDVQGLRTFLDTNPGIDVNAKDENVSSKYTNTAHAVLNRAHQGYTPLHLACDRGHADVVRLLLERGADPSIKVVIILEKVQILPDTVQGRRRSDRKGTSRDLGTRRDTECAAGCLNYRVERQPNILSRDTMGRHYALS